MGDTELRHFVPLQKDGSLHFHLSDFTKVLKRPYRQELLKQKERTEKGLVESYKKVIGFFDRFFIFC